MTLKTVVKMWMNDNVRDGVCLSQAWLESRALLSCSLLAYWWSQGEPLLVTLHGSVEETVDDIQVGLEGAVSRMLGSAGCPCVLVVLYDDCKMVTTIGQSLSAALITRRGHHGRMRRLASDGSAWLLRWGQLATW